MVADGIGDALFFTGVGAAAKGLKAAYLAKQAAQQLVSKRAAKALVSREARKEAIMNGDKVTRGMVQSINTSFDNWQNAMRKYNTAVAAERAFKVNAAKDFQKGFIKDMTLETMQNLTN